MLGLLLAAALATRSASALEVPVFDSAREEFLRMTPAERLAKFPGATDAEKAEAYAKKIGLTDGEIAKIREMLLK